MAVPLEATERACVRYGCKPSVEIVLKHRPGSVCPSHERFFHVWWSVEATSFCLLLYRGLGVGFLVTVILRALVGEW
jgi:hypothetical protein